MSETQLILEHIEDTVYKLYYSEDGEESIIMEEVDIGDMSPEDTLAYFYKELENLVAEETTGEGC